MRDSPKAPVSFRESLGSAHACSRRLLAGERTLVSIRALRFNCRDMKQSILVVALYTALVTNIIAQSPTPAPSPAKPPTDYDLQWGVKIPMRDKIELNATLYLPKTPDGSAPKTPVVFTLTPYISDTYHVRGAYFASHGYVFALVDVRGRGNSAGDFEPFANEPSDGHDVVEWLAQQPFCDGKVAMWGGSYAGFDQWATAKEFPPHLATIVPAAAAHPGLDYPSLNNLGYLCDMRWFTHTSGRTPQQDLFGDSQFWRTKFLDAYKKHIAFGTLDSFVGNPSKNFQRILKHPTVDAYYDAMVPNADQFKKMSLPILTITGQYDGDEPGAMSYYRDHIANVSPEARTKHFLIIGPWDHPGTRTPTDEVGGVKFGPAAVVDLNDLHRQWYDWTMKNGAKPQFLKDQVAYYLLAAGNTGANGEWKYEKSFAELVANPKTFYLDSKNGDANGVFHSGFLSDKQPAEGVDQFVNDPMDTSPGEIVKCDFDPSLFVARRLMKGSRLRLVVYSPNSIFWQKNYNSDGVVADETAKDAHTAHINVYHDAQHASSIDLPLR